MKSGTTTIFASALLLSYLPISLVGSSIAFSLALQLMSKALYNSSGHSLTPYPFLFCSITIVIAPSITFMLQNLPPVVFLNTS